MSEKPVEAIYKDLAHLNMIDKFVNIVEEYCDSPEIFIRAGGYHLVASVLGRFCTIPEMPSGNKPNPWFIISSIPGRMRRSAILNYVSYVYRNVLEKFYNDKISLTEDETAELNKKGKTEAEIEWSRKQKLKAYVNSTIIEEGSKEGIMDHLEEAHKNGVTEFAVMSPEFGAIISSMMEKSYQHGVSSLLSKLKYGEPGSVNLSQRGGKKGLRYVPPDLFITMYASMQEPKQYLTEAQSRQGLLRRLMIGYVKHSDLNMDDWKAPLRVDRWTVWNLLEVYSDELYQKMVELEQSRWYAEKVGEDSSVPIYFDIVRQQINDIAREIDEKLIHDDSDYMIYKQGTWEQLTELSAMHCVARFEIFKINNDTSFNITQDDLDTSRKFHDLLSKHAEEVLDEISEPPSVATSHEKDLGRIYRYIYRAGIEGIKLTDLGNLSKMLKDQLHEVVDTLLVNNKIKMRRYPTGKRMLTVYIATALLEDEKH